MGDISKKRGQSQGSGLAFCLEASQGSGLAFCLEGKVLVAGTPNRQNRIN